ncbi:type IV pilus modification protein PilV [Colwellia echini]|uniref:Type IV pilus modification protein PilV n=1 Tax=Colwellia echini TaxID=1982103 RepID=A0ABY3MVF4_9GAMM|nr:type IV pilus modification protein PilV [Colwellia echini]TYK65193.1 type IV pilus modification protein PilV [Colwellia echini]
MNKISTLHQLKRKQRGMTFLEVLIAVVILVTGILGAVALQAVAKKSSFDSMQRSLASSLAQDIVERMRGNSSNNLALYQVGSPFGAGNAAEQDCSAACTPTQIASYDVYEWEQALIGTSTKSGGVNGTDVGGLVNGVGCINVVGNRVTVVVSWQGKTELADGGSSGTGVANCGSSGAEDGDNNKRRQVVVNAFIL